MTTQTLAALADAVGSAINNLGRYNSDENITDAQQAFTAYRQRVEALEDIRKAAIESHRLLTSVMYTITQDATLYNLPIAGVIEQAQMALANALNNEARALLTGENEVGDA